MQRALEQIGLDDDDLGLLHLCHLSRSLGNPTSHVSHDNNSQTVATTWAPCHPLPRRHMPLHLRGVVVDHRHRIELARVYRRRDNKPRPSSRVSVEVESFVVRRSEAVLIRRMERKVCQRGRRGGQVQRARWLRERSCPARMELRREMPNRWRD